MSSPNEVSAVAAARKGLKYQQLLRPIGAYLDTLDASHLLLAESEEGFIWRCAPRSDPGELLYGVIVHDEVPQLADTMKQRRLGRVPVSGEHPAAAERRQAGQRGPEQPPPSLSIGLPYGALRHGGPGQARKGRSG